MNGNATVTRVLVVMVAASLACGLPAAGGAPPPATVPSGAPSAGSTPAPTAIATEPFAADDPFLTEELPPPPPQGMFDAMQAQVESGELTLEQGLITSLQLLAGEVTAETAFGDRQPVTMEGFGAVVEARHYLQAGADPAAKAEIERLLSIVVPDIDRLMEYAAPEGQASVGRFGLASASADETCTSIAQKGFPTGSALLCYLFKQAPLGANTARVFYPSSWGKNDPKLAYAQAALQAVFDSHAAYSQYGKIVNVDVVFTVLASPDDPASNLAEVTSPGAASRCEILIYPSALAQAEPNFKQTVAHEMFHCFQQWKFPAHFDSSWSVQDWWGEATAEYFSNVVYPSVNDEWPRVSYFGYNSATHPLVEMSYENWVFFQYLANQVGDAGVLALIQSMPAKGTTADQASQLAAYPNIENLFHQFGRDFVDKKIVDADKPTLVPTGWLYVPPQFRLTFGPGDHTVSLLPAPQFTLSRYGLNFAPGRVYAVKVDESGSPGLYTSRLFPGPANWIPLPPTVSSGCGKVNYYALATSSASGDPYTVAVTADVLQQTKCDPCLLGSWELNKDSFVGYISAPFIQTAGLFQPGDPQGTWRYTFDKTGTLAALFDFAFDYTLHQGDEVLPLDTEVLLTIDGPGQAMYWIPEDGKLMIQAVESGFHMEQFISINGQELGGGPLNLFSPFPPQGATTSASYSCSSTVLFLGMEGAQAAGLPSIEYDRVP
jgi:hypothetical protein